MVIFDYYERVGNPIYMIFYRLFIFLVTAVCIMQTAVAGLPELDSKLDSLEQMLLTGETQSVALIQELTTVTYQMDSEQQARFLVLQSVTSLYESDYVIALEQLEQAESLEPSDEQLSSIYLYKATANIPLGNFELAFHHIAKNLAKIERIEDVKTKLNSYLRLIALYYKLGAYEDMRLFASKAIDLGKGQDTKNHCYALLYTAVANLKLQAFDDAYAGFNQSAEYCGDNNNPLIVAMSKKGLGMIEIERNNFIAAESYLLNALEVYKNFKFQIEINHTNALLAKTYLGIGDEEKTLLYANWVMELPDNPDNSEYKVVVTDVLSSLYKKQGDFELAYHHLQLNQGYAKTLSDESRTMAQAYQMAKFDSEEKGREIALLNKERELYISMQQIKEREHTNMLLFVTLLVGGIFFLGVLVVAGLIQKRKYVRMAKIDALTGIYNRGAGQDMGENTFVQVLTRGEDFGLVLFDLDNFKLINETYGHGTGDWALKKVAEVVSSHIRSSDIFVRMGGEEFAIMLPYASEDKTVGVANKCREAIETINTHYSGHDFKLTASFGLAHLEPNDLSLDPVMHRAGVALYSAKSTGHNSVEQYKAEMESNMESHSIKSKLALS